VNDMIIFLKRALMKFGYEIRGIHYFYIQKSDKPKIIEILGLEGKTTLFKKIRNDEFRRVKPNIFFSKEQYLFPKFDSVIVNRLVKEIICNESEELETKRRKIDDLYLKSRAYKNYMSKHSIIFDEGIVKQNLEEIVKMIQSKDSLIIDFLNKFKFIIVKNEFDETYTFAKKRYGWIGQENLVEFKRRYDHYYENIEILINNLKENGILFKFVSTIDLDLEKINELLDFIRY